MVWVEVEWVNGEECRSHLHICYRFCSPSFIGAYVSHKCTLSKTIFICLLDNTKKSTIVFGLGDMVLDVADEIRRLFLNQRSALCIPRLDRALEWIRLP